MIFRIMFSLVYNHLKGEDCFRYLRMSLFISTETVGPPCFYRSPEWTNQTLNQEDRTKGISFMAASQIDATILHTGPLIENIWILKTLQFHQLLQQVWCCGHWWLLSPVWRQGWLFSSVRRILESYKCQTNQSIYLKIMYKSNTDMT